MTTFINSAVSAMVASLGATPAVSSQIGRVRLRPMAQSVSQAVIVRPMQSVVAEQTLLSMPVSWTSSIAVECYVRSSATTPPDQAVDSLLDAVYARLMEDPSLGGVVLGLHPQEINFDFDADGEQTTCATLVFSVRHRSPGATL